MKKRFFPIFAFCVVFGSSRSADSAETHWVRDIGLINPSGLESNSIYFAIGDIDGDGKPDLAVVENENELWMYQNITDSNGIRFKRRMDWEFQTSCSFYQYASPVLTDLNGDGRCEMIVQIDYKTSKPYQSRDSGNSLVWEEADSLLSGLSGDIVIRAAGDMDNDGDIDLIGSGGLYRNIGTREKPAFQRDDNPIPATNNLFLVCDYDGDAKLDFLNSWIEPIDLGVLYFMKNVSRDDSLIWQDQGMIYYGVGDISIGSGDLNNDKTVEYMVGDDASRIKLMHKKTGSFSLEKIGEIGPPQGFLETGLCMSDWDSDGLNDLIMVHTSRISDFWDGYLELDIFKNGGPQIGFRQTFGDFLFSDFIGASHYSLFQPTIHYDKSFFMGMEDARFTIGVKGVKGHDLPSYADHFDGTLLFTLNIKDSTSWGINPMPYVQFQDDSICEDPMRVDMNNDGVLELLMKVNGRYRFYAGEWGAIVWSPEKNNWELVQSGSELRKWSEGIRDTTFYRADVGDLNHDGLFDLVFSKNDGSLTYFENIGSDTLPKWREYPQMFEDIRMKTRVIPCLTDMDKDGDFDLLLTDTNGTITCFRQDTILNSFVLSKSIQPGVINLLQNFPNPFNNSTVISYNLSEPAKTTIAIFDIQGRKILEWVNGMQNTGLHRIVWNGMDNRGIPISSGMYIARIESKYGLQNRKMLFIK